MATVRPFVENFLRGLQTTRPPDGARSFNGYRIFRNLRTHRGEAEIRPGRALLQSIPSGAAAAAYDRVDRAAASGDPRVWNLNTTKRWLLEVLLRSDDASVGVYFASYQLAFNQEATGALKVIVQTDSGTVELDSVTVIGGRPGRTHLALLRDGDVLSLLVDGLVEDSVATPEILETPTAVDAVLGLDMLGPIDFVRLREGVPSGWESRRTQRLLSPRAKSVRACWRGAPDADGIIWDHSIYENHARVTGAGVTSEPTLALPHCPVQAMRSFVGDENKRKLFVVAGGQEWGGDL